jgi:hypothetical protein
MSNLRIFSGFDLLLLEGQLLVSNFFYPMRLAKLVMKVCRSDLIGLTCSKVGRF